MQQKRNNTLQLLSTKYIYIQGEILQLIVTTTLPHTN